MTNIYDESLQLGINANKVARKVLARNRLKAEGTELAENLKIFEDMDNYGVVQQFVEQLAEPQELMCSERLEALAFKTDCAIFVALGNPPTIE